MEGDSEIGEKYWDGTNHVDVGDGKIDLLTVLRALPSSSYIFYVLGLSFNMMVLMVTAETNGYRAKPRKHYITAV